MRKDKSISDIEGWKWNDDIPDKNGSHIEYRFFILHDKPINSLGLDDIRFLISQNSGLDLLVPIALESLKKNLFIEVEYYPGDLFMSLLQINDESNYWENNIVNKNKLIKLYEDQKKNMTKMGMDKDEKKKFNQFYKAFNEGETIDPLDFL